MEKKTIKKLEDLMFSEACEECQNNRPEVQEIIKELEKC